MKKIFVLTILFSFISCNALKTLTNGETNVDDDFFSDRNCPKGISSCGNNSLYDSLISFYRFNESGSDSPSTTYLLSDEISNNDFTLTTSASPGSDGGRILSDGTRGDVLECHGSGGCDIVASSLSNMNFGTNQDFSIAFWFNPNLTMVSSEILSFRYGAGSDVMKISYDTGSPRITVAFAGTEKVSFLFTQSLGVWNHIVMNINRSGGSQAFINGSSVGTSADSVTTGYTLNFTKFSMGYGVPAFAGEFDGRMDNLGIWSRPLSQTEAQSLYNNNF